MKSTTPRIEEKLSTLEQLCTEKGITLTHQRLEIFREVASSSDHPSVEQIYNKLKSKLPMISLDTVYRTLSTLETIGIIAKVSVADNKGRFDANLVPHHHLVCTGCKGIFDFYWPAFDKLQLPPEAQRWGKVVAKQVELRGICEDCLKREKSAGNP